MADPYDPGGHFWAEPFPAVVYSGSLSGSLQLFSWQEVLLDGAVGNWTSGGSPRIGVNNLREVNNSSPASGYSFPFFAHLRYEGQVSGQPFYSYSTSTPGVGAPSQAGSGPINVRTYNGATILSGIGTLMVNSPGSGGVSPTALQLTQPDNVTAEVSVFTHNSGQDGVITGGTQTIYGLKTFDTFAKFSDGALAPNGDTFLSQLSGTVLMNCGCFAQSASSPYSVEFYGFDSSLVYQAIMRATMSGTQTTFDFNGTGNSTKLSVDGTLGVTGTTAEGDTVKGGIMTSIGASDERLKKNVSTLPPVLDFVSSVHPRSYEWDEAACRSFGQSYFVGRHLGFVAQDLRRWAPMSESDTGTGGPLSRRGKDGMWRLDHNALIAVLWKAVQELTDRVRQLEKH